MGWSLSFEMIYNTHKGLLGVWLMFFPLIYYQPFNYL
jgi:hypothetical protein